MANIACIQKNIENNGSQAATFVIEPLDSGQAVTLGSTLRRSLISDIAGYSISGIRINDIISEYAIIPFLREDPLEIISNLKGVAFRESAMLSSIEKNNARLNIPGFILGKGPKIITAGMIKLPKNSLSVVNPQTYVCAITTSSELFCELDISFGSRLNTAINSLNSTHSAKQCLNQPKTLTVENASNIVKKASFKVKLIHDTLGNLKESLYFEIATDGSKSPKRCLYEAFKNALELLCTSFISLNSSTVLNILSN